MRLSSSGVARGDGGRTAPSGNQEGSGGKMGW